MGEKKSVYVLDIQFPDGGTDRIQVENPLSLGSDASNAISLDQYNIAPCHCTFKIQNSILSIVNHVEANRTKIGEKGLGQGKIYLLNKGDIINIDNKIKITVKMDKVDQINDNKEKKGQIEKTSSQGGGMQGFMDFYEKIERPGLLGRLYALLFEIVICTALYLSVVVPMELSFLFDPVREIILSLLKQWNLPYEEFVNHGIISMLCLFVILNTASSLLFSSTLGLAFMGVHTVGNFLVARFKACLRFFLGLFTGPFLIFDLPALFSWPTLKEALTGSKISYQGHGMKFLGLVLLPVFSLFIFLVPTITHFNTLTKPQYTRGWLSRRKRDQEPNFEAKFPLHQVEIKTTLEEHQHLLPYFEYKDNFVYPSIMFMDLQKKQSLSYGPAFFIDVGELGLKKIARNDPFFSKNFPIIHKYYTISEEQHSFENSIIDTLTYAEELSFFYQSILSLDFERLPHFITTISPIIGPYLKLKKSLLTAMASGLNGEIVEFKVGRLTFFEYKNPQRNIYRIFHPSQILGKDMAWKVEMEKDSLALYETFILNFIKRARPSVLDQKKVTVAGAFTSIDLVNLLYRIQSQVLNEEDYGKIINFFKDKSADTSNAYYAEALESSLISFQNSYSKLKNLTPQKAKALQNISGAMEELFDHTRTPGQKKEPPTKKEN